MARKQHARGMEVDELYSILSEAYRLERELEANELWEAHLDSEPKLRDLLLRISYDSMMHKMFLEVLFKNLRKFKFERDVRPPFDHTATRFIELGTKGIIGSLRDNENRVLELYLKALHGPSEDLIGSIWTGESTRSYFDRIRWLVAQEKVHDRLLRHFLKKGPKGS